MRRLRVAASMVLISAGVTSLVALQLPALPSTAVADALPTQPGSAFSTAVVLTANPQYGGLSLAVRGAEATASYTGTQAVADSQAVNLGYIGGLLNGPPNACFGSTSTSATAALNALEAASASGASTTSADGGVESVTVNPTPESAGATTSLVPVAIPSFLAIAAHSVAHVSYASGQTQEADATTTMTVTLLGGLISLNGLNWDATQESGSTSTASATFSMASVTIAGKTTDISSAVPLASAISLVNKVLAAFGLTLTLPVESSDPVTGTVTIGPLQLEVTGTSLTNTVLGKLNATETTLEEDIGKALDSGNSACVKVLAGYVGDGELVAGIVEGILAGGGVVDLELGGASADTEAAPDFVNPLDTSSSTSSGGGLNQSPSSLGLPSGLGGGSFSGNSGASSGAPSGATTTQPAGTPQAQSIAAPSALVHCVTSSPSGRPGCWSGAATTAAAALLVLGASLFAADIVRSRRRLIRPKETL